MGGANETLLESNGSSDVFVAKYNPDGTLVWAVSAGGADGDGGDVVALTPDNQVFVTGVFKGPAVFGAGDPNETVLNTDDTFDLYIVKYNPDGTLAGEH
jgi:hypothetical protein